MPTNMITPQIPLEIDPTTGAYVHLGMSDLTKVVDQNIKMVLLTNPGERLFNQNFGVGLRRYLFENALTIDRGSEGLLPLRENIISQFATYLPYITTEDLQINVSPGNNFMNIKIKYYVNESDTSSVFDLTIDEVNDGVI